MAERNRDKQLDEYLKKDSPLTRAYGGIGREEPPAALDARILAEARAAVGPARGGKPRWLMPLALAATVVLSVGVVMFMARQGAGPLPPEALPVPETKTATPPAAEKTLVVTPKATVTPKEAPVAAPREKPRFEAREVTIPPKVKTPEQWLAEIEALRRAGKHAEAEAELAEFRRRYPQYPLGQQSK